MKNNLKVFLLSAFLVTLGGVLSKYWEIELSLGMMEQVKAISYFVTLAGIVSAFSWYKRTATPVPENDENVPVENISKQNRVLIYLLVINTINAGVLLFSQVQPIQLMIGISLLVVLISPVVFRTMQEK